MSESDGLNTSIFEDSEVTFSRADDQIADMQRRLAENPEHAAEVAEVQEAMSEADRTYLMGLAAIRRAADYTQVDLARQLGITQSALSKIEGREDMLLSTMAKYLEAIGGNLRIIVEFDGKQQVEVDLSTFRLAG